MLLRSSNIALISNNDRPVCPELTNLIQSIMGRFIVKPIVGNRSSCGREQPNLVVIDQCTSREIVELSKLADRIHHITSGNSRGIGLPWFRTQGNPCFDWISYYEFVFVLPPRYPINITDAHGLRGTVVPISHAVAAFVIRLDPLLSGSKQRTLL